jgi:hypothetical protein
MGKALSSISSVAKEMVPIFISRLSKLTKIASVSEHTIYKLI